MGTVNYLLDTHTFLWAIRDEEKLSGTVKGAITKNGSNIYVSSVSAYEIMNKYRLGKLPDYSYIAENYSRMLEEFGANDLPLFTRHTYYAGKFKWEHRDPFDRLLAAQAFIEDMVLITNDLAFNSLSWLTILW